MHHKSAKETGLAVLRLQQLGKSFRPQHWLFRDLNLSVDAGQAVSLQGESGSGKSTLLNLVAGIEPASEGEVWIAGQAIHQLGDQAAAQLRARHIGFIFQAFHLLPNLPVWRNIALPLFLNGCDYTSARSQVKKALTALGMAEFEGALPADLSGGEQQRVALLRALVHQPKLVLADEPTGNLDPESALQALTLIIESVHATGAALLMVTHSEQAASFCSRHLYLQGGGLVERPNERPNGQPSGRPNGRPIERPNEQAGGES